MPPGTQGLIWTIQSLFGGCAIVPGRAYNAFMKVCLFDIDGTLLASGGAGKAAMEAALTTVFGTPAASSAVPFSGRTDRAIVRDLFALHNIPYVQANWQSFLAAYLGHLPQYLHSHNGRVLPGIADLLEALRQRGDVAVG